MKKILNTIKSNLEANNISKRALVVWAIGTVVLLAVCGLLIGITTGDDGQAFPVYINEVVASNTSYPNPDGRCCDYIELYNSADYPLDLSGFQLGDIAGSTRYAFPAGTVISPKDYLVVYCDSSVDDDRYAQFGISRSGDESFYLIAANNAIVDSVLTVPTDLDQAMIRLDWQNWGISSYPTPGRVNTQSASQGQDIYNAELSAVRISEFSVVSTGYSDRYDLLCDWIELHNTDSKAADISGFTLSDNVGNDKYTFPEGTMIPAGGYLVVYCSDKTVGEDIAPFALSEQGGESVVLKNSGGMIVEIVDTAEAQGFGSVALTRDGWIATQTPSPGYDNTTAGHEAYMRSIGADAGAVVISEVSAASAPLLADAYGEFSDWVELHNTGNQTVNLGGWYLSDDPDEPDKWVFPSLEIQPGERVIVFCSGRDIQFDGEVHTGFSLSASGEDLVLSSYLGITVDSVSFGESAPGTSYIFDHEQITASVTKHPSPGYPNDMDGYEAFCASLTPVGPLAIWEVMTSNDWYLPQELGECYDWVELRNISNADIRLSDYSITDDPEAPQMYVLPDVTLAPGESIVIILSGVERVSDKGYYHAGFTLNTTEDQLLLYNGNGKLLDYVYLKEIPLGHSYGRSDTTGGFYYMTPTPTQSNAAGYRLISSEPTSEMAPGVYLSDTGFTVNLSAEGTIYYTTNGHDPDTSSAVYSEPIQIQENTVLRAISVEPGKMPSEIYTSTFLIQTDHSIPVVSLVTDPDNLWGPDGIYKSGDITIKEEKRPANLAYCGEDGTFSLDCEISLHGATTVTAFDKKSFTVRFQDNYDGPLHYDVFGDGEVTTFSSLIVRTAHESTYSTQLRDALIGYVASYNCDTLISQKYRYVALYINGEYWGLYAFREHHSVEHYATYMDVPVDSVTMVKSFITPGTSLYELYEFCEYNSLSVPENYAYAESLLDMSSFADWIILQAYMGNLDINGNMRYYYCAVDGLWRCGLVDLDLGMFSHAGFENVANTFHHGRLMGSLLRNEEFQHLVATRLAELLAGPLSDENMIATIDMMAGTIRDEIPREADLWDFPVIGWERLVDEAKDYCDGRAQEMIDSLCILFGFSDAEREAYFGHLE